MTHDALGNPLSLQGSASLGAVNDFVEGFIACEARAVNILDAALDDTSPIVQAYCAALHMFSEAAGAAASARPFIDKALASPVAASEREMRFVHAVKAWIDGDVDRAIALHVEQAREHPRDLASLKLGHYHLFNQGNSPGMLKMALATLPASADVPYAHGMAAFAWEQCHFMKQAETEARQAITMCRKEPWAHHALGHVMLTEGRVSEGLAFMRDVSGTWTGLNSFMVTHNWWHLALFELELGHHDEVLRVYDDEVWGVAKDYTQDQIGAVSLLARLELAGVDVGARWEELAGYLSKRLGDHALPFLDMQYLYGLARAGQPEAEVLLRNMEAHVAALQGPEAAVWARVCLPASRGLLAHARGDWQGACDQLGQALPRMAEIGGSHAQRDLFAQIHLDAMVRGGHLSGAQNLLQQQLRGQPESVRLKRQASGVYNALGLGAAVSSLASFD